MEKGFSHSYAFKRRLSRKVMIKPSSAGNGIHRKSMMTGETFWHHLQVYLLQLLKVLALVLTNLSSPHHTVSLILGFLSNYLSFTLRIPIKYLQFLMLLQIQIVMREFVFCLIEVDDIAGFLFQQSFFR